MHNGAFVKTSVVPKYCVLACFYNKADRLTRTALTLTALEREHEHSSGSRDRLAHDANRLAHGTNNSKFLMAVTLS